MGWTHDYPDQVDHWKVYCKTVNQDWTESEFTWDVPKTITLAGQEETFTTPPVPAYIYYCFMVAAVDSTGRESDCPKSAEQCWECLFIKAEDMKIENNSEM